MNEIGQESSAKNLLAADIGGTSSRFALFRYETTSAGPNLSSLRLVRMSHLSTNLAVSFEELLHRAQAALVAPESTNAASEKLTESENSFFAECSRAMIAVPGVVRRDAAGRQCCARMAHVDWDVVLTDDLPLPANAKFINDFAAQAWACLDPEHQELQTIRTGKPLPPAREQLGPPPPIALVGAGTGLGVAMLLPPGDGYPARVVPSEGGHMLFPFVGEEEYRFADWFGSRIGMAPPSDLVVTGSGLAALHEFHTGEKVTPAEAAAKFSENSPVFQWFSRFYGRFCRDMILMTLSRSGLRITGGIAAANPGLVTSRYFSEELLGYRAYAEYLASIPVTLVGNTNAALWGAAIAALS